MDWGEAITNILTDSIASYDCAEHLNIGDFIAIILGIVFVNILTAIILIVGARTDWFTSLNPGPVNIWLTEAAWFIATLLSYVGLFLFYFHTLSACISNPWPNRQSRTSALAVLFLIGAVLEITWAAIFFYVQNIALSLWLVSIVFMYKFWVFVYMWTIMPVAAIFIIPTLVLYVVVFYSVAQLASLNDIPL